MIKKLILILICTVALNANLNTNIKNILGPSAYNKHSNLINYTFKNKSSYYKNGLVNYVALTSKLQNNGLLKLKYSSTKYIDISFKINNNPKKSLKIIKEILKSLGHYYYFVQSINNTSDTLEWNIKLKTDTAISPLKLSQGLAKRNVRVTDIRREGAYKWSYSIDSENSKIYKSKDLISNDSLSLKKPLIPYMVRVNETASVYIVSKSGNRWHPNVIFYDDDLNIIESFKDDTLHKELRLDVPYDTAYVKIDDLYSLANLKRGISITKE